MQIAKIILAAMVPLLLPMAGSAEKAPQIHGVAGQCLVSRVGIEPMRCKGQLIIMTQNGRTVYAMQLLRAHGSALVTFSGGKDEQPTLDHYTLIVDKVGLAYDKEKLDSYPAEGTCESNVSDDGSYSNSQYCRATTGGGLVVEIKMGPGPVK